MLIILDYSVKIETPSLESGNVSKYVSAEKAPTHATDLGRSIYLEILSVSLEGICRIWRRGQYEVERLKAFGVSSCILKLNTINFHFLFLKPYTNTLQRRYKLNRNIILPLVGHTVLLDEWRLGSCLHNFASLQSLFCLVFPWGLSLLRRESSTCTSVKVGWLLLWVLSDPLWNRTPMIWTVRIKVLTKSLHSFSTAPTLH